MNWKICIRNNRIDLRGSCKEVMILSNNIEQISLNFDFNEAQKNSIWLNTKYILILDVYDRISTLMMKSSK